MKQLAIVVSCAFSIVAFGCGSDIEPKGPVGTDVVTNNTANNTADGGQMLPDMSETVPDATMSSENAPTILELRVTPSTLRSGGTAVVSAVISDPQGPDDIAAGSLLDPQTQELIANFTQISGGSYEAEVTWDQLDLIRPINFGPAGGERAVTAEFIDFANERSTRSVTISLTCNGEPACDGQCGLERCDGGCVDPVTEYLNNDQNCGSCGNQCPSGELCDVSTCETAPPTPVGEPCTTDTGCSDDLICISTELAEINVPDGYCSIFCGSSADCGVGAECVEFDFGPDPISLCGRSCQSMQDCRSGYTCRDLVSLDGGSASVCAPPF